MADHLYFAWFMLDGRPWVEHECRDGVVITWAPPNPPWSLTDEGGITPSFDCSICGRHTTLGPADRCFAPDHIEGCPSCGGCGGRFDASFVEGGCTRCAGHGVLHKAPANARGTE